MKIVVLDGYTLNPGDLSWSRLERLGDTYIYERSISQDEVIERAKDAEIVLTNKTILDKDTLEQLGALKYIGVLATGYNVVDIAAASKLGIVVTNVPGYGTSSVAQMTFALLFELCLHVQRHHDAVAQGKWSQSNDFCFWDYPLIELAGKTMGIIGFGNIGSKVADIAAAFDMKIMVTDPSAVRRAEPNDIEWVGYDQLFECADVVSLHCPLTSQTKGLINTENLSKMKSSSMLINTARGPIIVEEDLADALNKNMIAGAGLDVLLSEPPMADNPLLTAINCIITPHISWATKEARTRLMSVVVDNLECYMAGKPRNIIK